MISSLCIMHHDMLRLRLIANKDRDNEIDKLNLKKSRRKIRLSQRSVIEEKKQEITRQLLTKGCVIFKAKK